MTDETPTETPEQKPETELDTLDPEAQRIIRERVTRLAFDGDPARFEEFVRVIVKSPARSRRSSCESSRRQRQTA